MRMNAMLATSKAALLMVGSLALPAALAKDDYTVPLLATLLIDTGVASHTRPAGRNEVTSQLVRLGAYPLDQALVASLGPLSFSQGASRGMNTTIDSSVGDGSYQRAGFEKRFGLDLPQHKRWTSVAATVALGLFYFFRRVG